MTASRHIRDTYPTHIVCIKCGVEKPVSAFRPNGRGRGRTRNDCMECARIYMALKRTAMGKEEARRIATASSQRGREKNPERRKERLRANPEKREAELARARQYKKENAAKVNAIQARRKAVKRGATPAWANQFFIDEAYELARLRTEQKTGGVGAWQVDHIVPMKSRLVCGLHVEHNLRVIPAIENLRKKNHWWPNMPGVDAPNLAAEAVRG